MAVAVVAFGSNVGDRLSNIRTAQSLLTHKFPLIRASSLYESAPMYLESQPAFINGVWAVRVDSGPLSLLHAVCEIERGLGRARNLQNGPRTIDLDILLFGNLRYEFGSVLTIPHPKIAERRFVLEPLIEIGYAGDFARHWTEVQHQDCRRLENRETRRQQMDENDRRR